MNVLNARALTALAMVALTMPILNAEGQTIREFSLPPHDGAESGIAFITVGADGNYWFTETALNLFGRLTPDGELIMRNVPTLNSAPSGIVSGPDGNIWFVETHAKQIGRITSEGDVAEFPVRCDPSGFIISGPEDSVWFSESCGDDDYIGQMSTGEFAGGVFEHYVGMKKGVGDLAWTADGDIWFVESKELAIGQLKRSGEVTDSILTSAMAGDSISHITIGADGNIWFPHNGADQKLDQCMTSGLIDEYIWPHSPSFLNGIATDSEGNIWLSDARAKSLWKVDVSASLPASTQYLVPSSIGLASITKGSDYQMLFIDGIQNQIGVIYLDGIFRDDFESD